MSLSQAYQVSTFVPEEYVDALVERVCQDFPLRYGQYEQLCWWSSPGIEQYVPIQGATPTKGQVGQRERVASVAVHFIIPREPKLLEQLVNDSIQAAHPWDEPVIIVHSVEVSAKVE